VIASFFLLLHLGDSLKQDHTSHIKITIFMNSLINHFFTFIIIIAFVGCKSTYPLNNQSHLGQIHEKVRGSETIYYYIDTLQSEQLEVTEFVFEEREIDEIQFLNKRGIVKRNWRALFKNNDPKRIDGKVSIKLCVNNAGDVIYAETIPEETTIQDSQYLKNAVYAAKGYKVKADQDAAPIECGKLVFDLGINAFKKK